METFQGEIHKIRTEKVIKYDTVGRVFSEVREGGLIVGLACGCFDILHEGHFDYLREAKSRSHVLFVGIESDASISLSKGPKRPFNSSDIRLKMLAELDYVDGVFAFTDEVSYASGSDEYTDRFRYLNPDFLAVSAFDESLSRKKMQTAEAGIGLMVIEHIKKPISTTLLLSMM